MLGAMSVRYGRFVTAVTFLQLAARYIYIINCCLCTYTSYTSYHYQYEKLLFFLDGMRIVTRVTKGYTKENKEVKDKIMLIWCNLNCNRV